MDTIAKASVARPARREFLKASALAGGGLVLAFLVPGARRAFAQDEARKPALPQPNAFLQIGADDRVRILIAHSEMGQGIWTTLPMLINEELGADWNKLEIAHAPAAPAYVHPLFGIQMTGGSSTTYSEFDRYRQVGAAARTMLLQAAAERFGVDAAQCRVDNGRVLCGDRSASFGDLAEAAGKIAPPTEVALKPASEWTRIGKSTKRLDTPEKITGRATFGIDVTFPGLLTAVVARAPVFGGKVASFDAAKAKAVPGVVDVVQVPSGIAVVAQHYWAAKAGRDALTVQWDEGPVATLDTQALIAGYREKAKTEGVPAAQAGDVAAGLSKAAKTHRAEYSFPYLAHAPMEPLNCTVKIGDGACEIWTGTQFQTGDQAAAAQILGIAPEKVTVHTTFLGGAFGRRATPTHDFVVEAVHVAKAAGKPVKVVWSREDDIRGGYYRPAYVHAVEAGVGDDGKPVAWRQRIVGQSILAGTPFEPMMVNNGIDATSTEGAADSPYLSDVPDRRVDLHSTATGVPVLWWRSVGHTHTAFAMESFIDELAHAAKQDPLAYREALLEKHPRHLAVLKLAAEKAGWGTPLPQGRARGIAVHESFQSFVAQVAEVSVQDRTIRVHRVVCAIDCGTAVNPDAVVAQMESGIAFGLAAALHGRLDIEKGRVRQSNFHDYRVLRINEMPNVEVHIHDSGLAMGGAGEPGTPPIAPAVANAVFALTGQRLRDLPLQLG